jgi:hypothetical protein
MKSLKLLVGATAACVLVGASGIAMAQTVNNCDDGSIWLASVDEVVVEGRSCAIVDTIVKGNVTATGGQTVSLISSRVGGDVTVTGAGNAIIVGNLLYNGALTTNDNENAIVQGNITEGGSVVVNRNLDANVQGNVAANKIRCTDNVSLQSSGNIAKVADQCP